MSLEWWKAFFEIGGVVLLLLTFAFGAGALIVNSRLNALQNAQLRAFDKDLTDAKTELGKQQKRAADAETIASEAKQAASQALADQQEIETNLRKQEERAATAEKALLELKNTLADRALSDKQVITIANKLRSFAGQEYEVTAYWDSKESVGIANRIHAALRQAHWKYLSPDVRHSMFGGVIGVLVWRHPDADESTKKATDSLISALTAEGIEAAPRLQNPVNNPKHNKIALSVGAKR